MDQTLAILLVAISVLLSGWWAAKNHAPEAGTLICVMALDIPLISLSIVQSAILKRELDFKSLSICSNASAIAGGLIGLGMAALGFRAWSLVGQQLAKDAITAILLWRFSHWRPRFSFSWRHLKELTSFSFLNFVGQMAILADMQASSVILGLFFGPVALGLYRIADRLMNGVVTVAMSAIQAVSLPEFSRLQHQPEALRKSAMTCLRLTASVTLPSLCGLAVVSTPLMATIGKSWIPASHALTVLCLLGIAIVFAYFTGPLLQALSRVREVALLEWGRMFLGVIVLVPAAIIARQHSITVQIMAIALARFVTGALVVAPIFVFILMRICNITLRQFVSLVFPSAMSAAAVVVSVLLFAWTGWLQTATPILLLSSEVAIGGAVGITVLLAIDFELRKSTEAILHRSYYRVLALKQSA